MHGDRIDGWWNQNPPLDSRASLGQKKEKEPLAVHELEVSLDRADAIIEGGPPLSLCPLDAHAQTEHTTVSLPRCANLIRGGGLRLFLLSPATMTVIYRQTKNPAWCFIALIHVQKGSQCGSPRQEDG